MTDASPTRRPAARWAVIAGAAFLMAVGGAVLAGWALDIQVLKALTTHNVTMKPNAAVAMLLSGFSAWCALGGGPRRRRLSQAAAAVVLAIGAATLSQHVVGWDLGIDELLFAEPPGERATVSPGRMGPPASLCFALGGLALLLRTAGARGRRLPSHWLGCAILVIAMLPLLGYILGAVELYGIARYTGIAPHTAVSLVVLALVILFLRPDAWPVSVLFAPDAGGMLARRLLPAAVLVPPVLGFFAAAGQERGWYDADFSRVAVLLGLMIVFTCLVWTVSKNLSSFASARDRAERAAESVRVEAERLSALNLESSSLIDTLLENAPIGFAFLDRDLRFVRVNALFARANRLAPEAHVGRALGDLRLTSAGPIAAAVRQVFESGRAVASLEILEAGADDLGGERAWLASVYPMLGSEGAVTRAGLVFVEITERKRLEEQRSQLLESERAAREVAERAGLVKDEFLATLSHELRTPLSAITGWAGILRAKAIDDLEVRQGIETIDRNARVQSQLIEDLLDVSRIVSGKLRLDVQPVDLPAVVEAAVAAVAPSAEAKGLRLQSLVDPHAMPVHGDPSRLQQVVWNLLTNAVKFTPRGGRVQVELRRAESQAEVVVADTGAGIDPAFLPHVFERFRQADASTTRRHGGLGLGLSIVRQLAEMHGGSVRVASPGPNRGATFVVALPLAVAHGGRRDGGGSEAPDTAAACDHTSLAGVRVLVVDDEPDARALLRRVLESCDATVVVCGTVDEAVAALDAQRPDVLVSDIGMPGRDGYDLIQEVRRRFESRDVSAIALTAFARTDDRRRALLAGYQMHISKPVDLRELIAAVATLVGRTGVHPTSDDVTAS